MTREIIFSKAELELMLKGETIHLETGDLHKFEFRCEERWSDRFIKGLGALMPLPKNFNDFPMKELIAGDSNVYTGKDRCCLEMQFRNGDEIVYVPEMRIIHKSEDYPISNAQNTIDVNRMLIEFAENMGLNPDGIKCEMNSVIYQDGIMRIIKPSINIILNDSGAGIFYTPAIKED